ncbi:BON domain-containing protein [Dyella sp. SG609]|uniref:BON domain-containing protein n=1 Tax=Dyella sp. SG609 TaxID=2587018 RepID=UPI0017BB94D1|nr:BON domain-containing protein [Dyella sp. SG609]NKJ20379.1 osmotically-inducible protein OsmY [Dyella sp. SG609]
MKHRHPYPSGPQRGGYGAYDETWRGPGSGPWREAGGRAEGRGDPRNPQGRRAGPGYRDHDRYGPHSDYLSATAEGYGDIDEGYLPPAWDEAGPQHGGYRNTFASDTGGYGSDRPADWRERWQDEYPRGFAGYGTDRAGRLQGPHGVRRDYGDEGGRQRFGQGYGSPSGGASWGGPHWDNPQYRDYQADYGRRQYARSPTDFMDERYPFGHDYGAGPSHYRQAPKGYQRSDERIREDVCERLSEDPRIDARELEVSVQGGVVTLEGTVPSRQMKHLAEDCADRSFGVKDVENRVRVEQRDHRDEDLRSSTAGAGTYTGAAQKH